jgi:hypothetical protein
MRQPPEPNGEERLLAANLLHREQLLAEYETEARQRRIDLFVNATLFVIVVGAFFAVGVILSPGFTIF